MKRTHVYMNESLYCGLSILELSKTLMIELWHD